MKFTCSTLQIRGVHQCLFLAEHGQGCEGGKVGRTKLFVFTQSLSAVIDCACCSVCTVSLCVCRIHMLLDLDVRVWIGKCASDDLWRFSLVTYSLVLCRECLSSRTSIHCSTWERTFWCSKLWCSRHYVFATLTKDKLPHVWNSAMPFSREASFPRVLYWCATCTQRV